MHCEAILREVFPEWQKLYREAFNAGVMFEEDAGPFYGRAIIYKLQGKLHVDSRDAGPSVSFGTGYYTGGQMIIPQLKAKLR
jgi:hypothetical protein